MSLRLPAKRVLITIYAFIVTGTIALAQASVPSLAEYKKKQDDGIAEAVRQSQLRAQSGKLSIGATGAKSPRKKPSVLRIGVHPRQTGVDNRHGTNVR
jgi:hypothetical protein